MDIVSIAAIAVIVYIAVMFIVRMGLVGMYLYFVFKFFDDDSTSSLSSEQFNPNLDNTQLAIGVTFGWRLLFLCGNESGSGFGRFGTTIICLPTTIIASEVERACMHMPALSRFPVFHGLNPMWNQDVEPCQTLVEPRLPGWCMPAGSTVPRSSHATV